MSVYVMGDLQGCNGALDALLAKIDFNPGADTLYALGDLVNRGPDSAATLRRLRSLDSAAVCLLGNHDLHALAVASGVRQASKSDTLASLLQADDASTLLTWLRHQALAVHAHGWLMVHAGVLPQWTVANALQASAQIESQLRSAKHEAFLHTMYGNEPNQWKADWWTHWEDPQASRVAVNALTRLRFCTAQGVMEFATKEGAGASTAPAGYMPWFEVPNRATQCERVAFGHWSLLGLKTQANLLALDTGCVWGGALSAARLDARGDLAEVIQVRGIK
jgi:bis(5'-nucleosyl)-tetraphosphatase (symmetrical)